MRQWKFNTLWSCLLLAGFQLCCEPSPLVAQQTTHASTYTRTLWTVADGLPEDTVQALVSGKEGSLWIGTTGGLAKTGGLTIRTRVGLNKLVDTNNVSALAIVRDGTLWIGTEGSGLLRLVKRETTRFSMPEGLSNGFVRCIFEDSKLQLWVGTDRGLFKLVHGTHLERVDATVSVPEIAVRSVTEDSSGNLWVGGSRLLSIAPAGKVTQYLSPKTNNEGLVAAIQPGINGQIWLGLVDGLAELDRGHLRRLPEIHASIRCLLQSSDGTLWIGTVGDGLWTLRQGKLTKMQNPGMLPSDTVLSLLQDHFGQVWVGTQAGLVRIEKSLIDLVSLPDERDHGYETISGDRDGNLWVAAQKLYHLQGDTMEQITHGLPNVSVRCVYRTRDGAFWIGTDGSGAYRLRNGKVQHYAAPHGLTSNVIRGFLEDRKGDVWIATDDGVNIVRNADILKLTEASGLAYFSTRSLFEGRDGTILIGTDRGLSVWKDGHFVQNAATAALAEEKVWSSFQDREETFWFGTREHGLFSMRGGIVQHYTTEQGLPTNSIYKVLQDHRGRFWISGPNIIWSLQESEMEEPPAAHATLSPLIYAFPSEGVQMYGGVEQAGYLAADDSVWFPSNKGAVHLVADGMTTEATAPRVFMFEILEDGLNQPISGLTRVPANVLRVSFRLSANYMRPQQFLRFRYKLEGLGDAWNEARTEDIATYTNLKPGSYRLRVQVTDMSVPGSSTETSFEVYKAPFFYQTKLFYFLCILLLGFAGWAVNHVRVRQLRGRFQAVLGERTRLAREMHDTVIQGCAGISSLLEAAACTAGTDEIKQQRLLEYARELAITTIGQARQAVWAMRQGPETSFDFVTILRGIGTQVMREESGIVVNIEAASTLVLPSSIAHELSMIVREAVNNAAQHSGTTTITLLIGARNDSVTVEVVDYGHGMPSSEQQVSQNGHYGLIGMRERMKRIGGQLQVHSELGKGTTIRLLLQDISQLKVEDLV